ncbi:transcriptional regulator [Marinithermofilum abyssi]|uniref:Transcriptional regulator n=1 Tax=Marinithermofilum abyssi TaxID=1571185 RepID=A0A8J2YAM6_9BACL|nr:helix-turn-helix transcriptional regulator [Marinithermofilum abyssi]GGE16359.1 transcriptional regulator [Marinithermofilum abyssi]
MNIFATRLRELRQQHGLRQSDVAKKLGITESAYGYYEQGRREPPYKSLQQLADLFDVSVDYLLGRTDIPSRIETEAAHRSDDPMADWPKEAREDVENFKEFIRKKYGID